MEARAIARFVRVSPLKADRVLQLIRGHQVDQAQEILAFTKRPIATTIAKILTSAVANATVIDEEVPVDRLFIKEAVAETGPTMKRIRPRAQGRANRIVVATR
jgi:large subunit ribosomal protein L22